MIAWGDLNVRARGLGTHLLSREQLEWLAEAPDLASLAERFAQAGLPPAGARSIPSSLELSVRRAAAARLRVLARWSAQRTATLAVIFEDEDRRSLRAIVRGALQGAPGESRLAGLIPTPTLPEKALAELASKPTVVEVATLLVAWGNPNGSVLLDEARQEHPDPLCLEARLNHEFATRALRMSRRVRRLREYVRRVIDLENAYAALGLADQGEDVPPDECFLAGGKLLGRETFLEAARAGSAEAAVHRLGPAFAGTPYAGPLARRGGEPAALEAQMLQALLAEVGRWARLHPLGPAPLLQYLLRLRAEALNLRRVIWGVALGSPPALIIAGMIARR